MPHAATKMKVEQLYTHLAPWPFLDRRKKISRCKNGRTKDARTLLEGPVGGCPSKDEAARRTVALKGLARDMRGPGDRALGFLQGTG